MSLVEQERTIEIEASPKKIYEVLIDYENYPEWISDVNDAKIISKDSQGRGKIVEFFIKVLTQKMRYRLKYKYEKNYKLSWTFVEGDFKDIHGSYELEPIDKKTILVKYRLVIDSGMLIPSFAQNRINKTIARAALRDLKYKVESR